MTVIPLPGQIEVVEQRPAENQENDIAQPVEIRR